MKVTTREHSLLCASENTKIALIYVCSCTLCTYLTFSTHRPSDGSNGNGYWLWVGIVFGIFILIQLFMAVKCIRERIVLASVTISLMSRLVASITPRVANSATVLMYVADYLLWSLAVVVSVTMLISAVRKSIFKTGIANKS